MLFSFLPFKGKVRLRNPQHLFQVHTIRAAVPLAAVEALTQLLYVFLRLSVLFGGLFFVRFFCCARVCVRGWLVWRGGWRGVVPWSCSIFVAVVRPFFRRGRWMLCCVAGDRLSCSRFCQRECIPLFSAMTQLPHPYSPLGVQVFGDYEVEDEYREGRLPEVGRYG